MMRKNSSEDESSIAPSFKRGTIGAKRTKYDFERANAMKAKISYIQLAQNAENKNMKNTNCGGR